MPIYALDGVAPQLAADANFIAPDAVVIGAVTLARDASIWFGAMLRGDNERITVGEGTNIQDQCMLHTDIGYPLTIGPGCTIGHKAMLHGCTIGENSLVGMSATVLNGAVIGSNCLIGAGALVTEGKQIPDNSLVVGMPARVVRTLTDDEIAGLKRSAEHYVANGRRYIAGLSVVS
ncbi:gamma carbonic anhydrase family protein [Devosia sp.]|uniref:gamma carbonic anhydrase family protein n=1 Tax=Devosia sp. TaxID=1871048 RepID=UPI003A8F392D